MKEKGPSFLEFAETFFYEFSQIPLGSLNLVFSKKIFFPVIKYESNLEIRIPLPRKYNDNYLFEGMLFNNNQNGRKNLWCLFLTTLYHMAAHACVSKYFIYETWKKSKTEDVCFSVIDYLEDLRVERYFSCNPELLENLKKINHTLQTGKKSSKSNKELKFFNEFVYDKIKKMKTEPMDESDDIIAFANLLYKNREFLPKENPPYCERHTMRQILLTETTSPNFEPHGAFLENVMKLDKLWLVEEQLKSKIFKKYEKKLKGLGFNAIIIPQGDFYNFVQTRKKIMPLLRRIKQQVQTIKSHFDVSKIDYIGNLNMQMVIQSLSSESQLTDIFERDEIEIEKSLTILIDNSSSMDLQFEHVKEFTICVAEAINDLAAKSDAWALFSFDSNFKILKDFEEKYDYQVQARIGSLDNNGISILPNAIELIRRILLDDPRERKYIFVITDGHHLEHVQINQHLSKVRKKLEASGISLIAIGVSKSTSKRFRNSIRGSSNLGQLVTKFITAYSTVSSD